MYFNDGMFPNEIGDFDVVEHDGALHLFYLTLPNHDSVGHLKSDDGIRWEPLPDALRTGAPGEFDADQIWTMGLFRHDGRWHMLYTSNERRGTIQRIGLARSDDLLAWTKFPGNPVASPDPRWYEVHAEGNYRSDWRDPHIVADGGKLHAFLCARERNGLLNRRGCAGYFTSTDGERWTVQPPACTPRVGYDFECPSVFKLDGRWYLVAICGAHDRSVYRVAERIEGPWRRPCDDAITPGQNQSLRPCRFKGRMHLFHWTRGPRDWNAYRGGGHYSAVASPKEAWADETGALHLKSCDWSPLYRGEPRPLPADPGSAGAGTWKASGGGLAGDSEFGTGVWVSQAEHEDFELRAEFKADPSRPAREFGFALRTDEHGDQGVFAGLVPGRFEAQLVKVVNNHRHGPQSLWRGRSVIQRYHVPAPPTGSIGCASSPGVLPSS
ncbi:MAG: family 43 glycosylhydrolase [Planctomycetota bacterium]|nr:family 43 glycosylhydrolase [Planctomycetota bacterium]